MKSWLTPQGPEPTPAYLEEYIGDRLLRVSVIFIILLTLTVLARFWAKTTVVSKLGAEDWLTIPALASSIGICIVAIISVKRGAVGYHLAAASIKQPGWPLVFGKSIWAISFLHTCATALPKMSILCFYLRLFPLGRFRLGVYATMALVVGLWISIICTLFLQCTPLAYAWDRRIKGGRCIDTKASARWIPLPSIIIDLCILILPLPMVWRLKKSIMQRLGLTLTFVTGGVGIIASCLRMHYFFKLDAYVDPLWTVVTLFTWTIISPSFYLIAACLPTFRPVLFKTIPEIWSRRVGSKLSKGSYRPSSHGQSSDKSRHLKTFAPTTTSSSFSPEPWTPSSIHHGDPEWIGEASHEEKGATVSLTTVQVLPTASDGKARPVRDMEAYYQHT